MRGLHAWLSAPRSIDASTSTMEPRSSYGYSDESGMKMEQHGGKTQITSQISSSMDAQAANLSSTPVFCLTSVVSARNSFMGPRTAAYDDATDRKVSARGYYCDGWSSATHEILLDCFHSLSTPQHRQVFPRKEKTLVLLRNVSLQAPPRLHHSFVQSFNKFELLPRAH